MDLEQIILRYEKDFFKREFCKDRQNLDMRIHDEFTEFGQSGCVYDKGAIIDYLINDPLFSYEFINSISESSYEYKEKIPDEFAIAYEYIHDYGLKSLDKLLSLNDNNKERILASFENFPLFKIWKKECYKFRFKPYSKSYIIWCK